MTMLLTVMSLVFDLYSFILMLLLRKVLGEMIFQINYFTYTPPYMAPLEDHVV